MQGSNKWGFPGPNPQLAQLCPSHSHTCKDVGLLTQAEQLLNKSMSAARMDKSTAPSEKIKNNCNAKASFWNPSLPTQMEDLICFTKPGLFYALASRATPVESDAFLVKVAFYNKRVCDCIV